MTSLKLNGKSVNVKAEPGTPLLWVLRDELQMTGTMFGCGMVQCGYCQSGQLMSACTLLTKIPQPSDADIDQTMSGNICRCGTYPRIRIAVHQAAKRLEEGKA